MEGMNAEFTHLALPQGEWLKRLNQIAIRQMQVLTSANLQAMPGARMSYIAYRKCDGSIRSAPPVA